MKYEPHFGNNWSSVSRIAYYLGLYLHFLVKAYPICIPISYKKIIQACICVIYSTQTIISTLDQNEHGNKCSHYTIQRSRTGPSRIDAAYYHTHNIPIWWCNLPLSLWYSQSILCFTNRYFDLLNQYKETLYFVFGNKFIWFVQM